jgi:hypothetical protein
MFRPFPPRPLSRHTVVPSFVILGSFRPRTLAIAQGVALSVILFCITGFAIRYSWIHILHVRIREVELDTNQRSVPEKSSRDSSGDSIQPIPSSREESNPVSDRIPFDVIPVGPADTTQIEATRPGAASNSLVPPGPQRMVVGLRLESYTGTYKSDSPSLKIVIETEGNHLVLETRGHPPRVLSPTSQTLFSITGDRAGWVQFRADNYGRIYALSLTEQDSVVTARRR